jgi:hypothetical protein
MHATDNHSSSLSCCSIRLATCHLQGCHGSIWRPYITNHSINPVMEEIAKACYNLDAKEIGQYSMHSIHIGTAVHLHDTNLAPAVEIEQLHGILAQHSTACGPVSCRHPHNCHCCVCSYFVTYEWTLNFSKSLHCILMVL